MHYGLSVVIPPSAEPLSLAEAKAHMLVETTADDNLIQALIVSAREYIERCTERQIVAATLLLTLDWMPGYTAPGMSMYPYGDFYSSDRGWDEKRTIRLRRPPLIGSLTVNYLDTTGTWQVLDPSIYTVDGQSQPARLAPSWGNIWPVTRALQNAVTIQYQAGYPHTTVAASCPAGIQTVMPASMNGIIVGTSMKADLGAAQETITVSAVSSTTFTATFANTHTGPFLVTGVPQGIRQAMLLLLAHWYLRREGVSQGQLLAVPMTVDALLASYWTGEYGL